jgi:hypothetical protein
MGVGWELAGSWLEVFGGLAEYFFLWIKNTIRDQEWSSLSLGTFFPISEFSYFVIRFLNQIFFCH